MTTPIAPAGRLAGHAPSPHISSSSAAVQRVHQSVRQGAEDAGRVHEEEPSVRQGPEGVRGPADVCPPPAGRLHAGDRAEDPTVQATAGRSVGGWEAGPWL